MAFYRDGLGLQTVGLIGAEFKGDDTKADGTIVTFVLGGGIILALYPRTELAKDAGVPLASAKPGAFSIAQAVARREDVDGIMAQAEAADASLTDPPHDRAWRIYSGCFLDLECHLWEILWNPALDLAT